MNKLVCVACALIGVLGPATDIVTGADWPMWRYDAGRSGVTPERFARVPEHVAWSVDLGVPMPAWPASQEKLQFDAVFEPVVAGERVFISSSANDCVHALDLATGSEIWRFHANGPVRFAPLAQNGRVYFSSDDGHLYCVRAADGALVWKFRAAPAANCVIGNDRFVSAWPVRGGVVGDGQSLYFAAGIWPFMGIYLYSLNADTGSVLWSNSGSGSRFIRQPHDAWSFAGVAPQGYLALSGDTLLVAGGRSAPAIYNRTNGELKHFNPNEPKGFRAGGGYALTTGASSYWSGGSVYAADSGKTRATLGVGLMDGQILYSVHKNQLQARQLDAGAKDGLKAIWDFDLPVQDGRLHLKAGDLVVVSGAGGVVIGVDTADGRPKLAGEIRVKGQIGSVVASQQRLIVSTCEGVVWCLDFERGGTPATHHLAEGWTPKSDEAWASRVGRWMKEAGDGQGYCLLLGIGSGSLLETLLAQTKYTLIVAEKDPAVVARWRRLAGNAGIYGRRISILEENPYAVSWPPYVADLIVSEVAVPGDLSDAQARCVANALRPYGGLAELRAGGAISTRAWEVAGAVVASSGGTLVVRRPGALPGTAPWTHQYADAANTVCSADASVKAPLGLLWFGGPANDPVLPRHGHGPSPLVAGGRLFIEGRDMLRAVDVYTGRLLWQQSFQDIGKFYDQTEHQPGANEIGANYALGSDAVYLFHPDRCLKLDMATGKTLAVFVLPGQDGVVPKWGSVRVEEDWLIVTAEPLEFSGFRAPRGTGKQNGESDNPAAVYEKFRANAAHASGSQRLLVLDRHTGHVIWQRQAEATFRHNAVASGGGRIYVLDGFTPAQSLLMRKTLSTQRVLALDVRTGRELWRKEEESASSWLSYSARHDVLIRGHSRAHDRAVDEPSAGLAAYRASDGAVLWVFPGDYSGPVILRGDELITQPTARPGYAIHLLTGKLVEKPNPLTGLAERWTYKREYGCNTAVAGRNLLTFRSGAAGFVDLVMGGWGTGNLGGFKSGCTSNLIIADGVLNAPDYTRTCTCAYQNQASLAFVNMPDAEAWVWSESLAAFRGTASRYGVNFGAPGDYHDAQGTYWVDWPNVSGSSPSLGVSVSPAETGRFCSHAGAVSGPADNRVAASALTGISRITLPVKTQAGERRLVRLVFSEPSAHQAGERVFDVKLQGRTVLEHFDIFAETGGRMRSVQKEFVVEPLAGQIVVELTADKGQTLICGVAILPLP